MSIVPPETPNQPKREVYESPTAQAVQEDVRPPPQALDMRNSPQGNQVNDLLTSEGRPTISDDIEYRIYGNDIQFVEITLDPGETAIGEPGAMMYMDNGIQIGTTLSDGSQKSAGMLGSLIGAAKRKLSGELAFIGHFTNKGTGKRAVAFAAAFPGQIVPIDLQKVGGKVFCQKDAFLCAAKGTSIGIGFTQRLGAGWWGGESFILQTLEGDGLAFIHAGGSIIEKDLVANQTIYVDTGSIVGFQAGVDFDIQMVGGIKNMMFGGEDMFLSSLTGPGKIWIQSMPYSRLIGTVGMALNEHNKR